MGRHRDSTRRGAAPPPRLDAVRQARLAQAIAAHQRGEIDAACAVYQDILEAVPRCFDALNLLGAAAIQKGDLTVARDLINRAIAVDPRQAHAHSNLSRALLELGDAAGAVAACDRALVLKPEAHEAWYNRGNALLELRRLEDAETSYRRALALRPQYPEALNNLGTTLRLLRRNDAAIECFDACLRLSPGFADALNNRGLVHLELGRDDEALASFDAALQVAPLLREALNNRGNTLMSLKRFDEAAETFARLASIAPDYMYVYGNLLHARMQCCDWRDHAPLSEHVIQSVRAGTRADFPFSYLCVDGSAQAQLACARTYTADQHPPGPGAGDRLRYRHDRIRIAYVSGDFGEHPVSYLLAGVFEAHDRTAFETIAISWGRAADGALRARLERAFARFIDVSGKSDAEIVALMRDLEIDIAVDLTGHTRGHRTGIFARRAAPVQVNYLGLPATMGASYIDYLVADRILVPDSQRQWYLERVVWMPDCFQPNDRQHQVTPPPPRASLGLPEQGAVLCSFNSQSKLNPPVFDAWMRLLLRVPDAVLWLVAAHPVIAANLRREAAARGVDPARLVFAPRAAYAEYLGRYAHADLFLDCAPFNAGATASDALAQGLPVLTCAGDSFASRAAASLLQTLGLTELIATTLADYEERAVALLQTPGRLGALRAQLRAARDSHVLFDTTRYCRHLESAWRTMWQRNEAQLAPAAFAVEAIDTPRGHTVP